jgi:hypothetical protein
MSSRDWHVMHDPVKLREALCEERLEAARRKTGYTDLEFNSWGHIVRSDGSSVYLGPSNKGGGRPLTWPNKWKSLGNNRKRVTCGRQKSLASTM